MSSTTPHGDRRLHLPGRGRRLCLRWPGRMGGPRRPTVGPLVCHPWPYQSWLARRPSWCTYGFCVGSQEVGRKEGRKEEAQKAAKVQADIDAAILWGQELGRSCRSSSCRLPIAARALGTRKSGHHFYRPLFCGSCSVSGCRLCTCDNPGGLWTLPLIFRRESGFRNPGISILKGVTCGTCWRIRRCWLDTGYTLASVCGAFFSEFHTFSTLAAGHRTVRVQTATCETMLHHGHCRWSRHSLAVLLVCSQQHAVLSLTTAPFDMMGRKRVRTRTTTITTVTTRRFTQTGWFLNFCAISVAGRHRHVRTTVAMELATAQCTARGDCGSRAE